MTLRTLKEVATVLHVPPRRVRELVNGRRIAYVPIGKKKVMIADEAIERFISQETVEPCRAETQAPSSAQIQSAEDFITSFGRKAVAAASAAQALRISQKRKKSSASSSSPGPVETARVIQIKRS